MMYYDAQKNLILAKHLRGTISIPEEPKRTCYSDEQILEAVYQHNVVFTSLCSLACVLRSDTHTHTHAHTHTQIYIYNIIKKQCIYA